MKYMFVPKAFNCVREMQIVFSLWFTCYKERLDMILREPFVGDWAATETTWEQAIHQIVAEINGDLVTPPILTNSARCIFHTKSNEQNWFLYNNEVNMVDKWTISDFLIRCLLYVSISKIICFYNSYWLLLCNIKTNLNAHVRIKSRFWKTKCLLFWIFEKSTGYTCVWSS